MSPSVVSFRFLYRVGEAMAFRLVSFFRLASSSRSVSCLFRLGVRLVGASRFLSRKAFRYGFSSWGCSVSFVFASLRFARGEVVSRVVFFVSCHRFASRLVLFVLFFLIVIGAGGVSEGRGERCGEGHHFIQLDFSYSRCPH